MTIFKTMQPLLTKCTKRVKCLFSKSNRETHTCQVDLHLIYLQLWTFSSLVINNKRMDWNANNIISSLCLAGHQNKGTDTDVYWMEQWSKFQGDLILIGRRITGPETEDTSQLLDQWEVHTRRWWEMTFARMVRNGTKDWRQDQSNRAVGPSRSGAASQIGILVVGGASWGGEREEAHSGDSLPLRIPTGDLCAAPCVVRLVDQSSV